MNKKNGVTGKQLISLTQNLENRWEVNLGLFLKRRSNYNSCQAPQINMRRAFCAWEEYKGVHYSVSTQQRKLCSCQNTWVTVRPPLHSPSQTVTPWPLLCLIQSSFCCRLISEQCLEDMQWKLNSALSHHLKNTSCPLACNWKSWLGLKIIHLWLPVWPFVASMWRISFLEIMSCL